MSIQHSESSLSIVLAVQEVLCDGMSMGKLLLLHEEEFQKIDKGSKKSKTVEGIPHEAPDKMAAKDKGMQKELSKSTKGCPKSTKGHV
jgi:hypothetical protein